MRSFGHGYGGLTDVPNAVAKGPPDGRMSNHDCALDIV
jgi:hypothetical protein